MRLDIFENRANPMRSERRIYFAVGAPGGGKVSGMRGAADVPYEKRYG